MYKYYVYKYLPVQYTRLEEGVYRLEECVGSLGKVQLEIVLSLHVGFGK